MTFTRATSKRMTKPIHAIAVVIIAMIAVISAVSIFVNSATPTQVAGQNDVEATVQTLNSAQHIKMKKYLFSIRDKWTVQADGETVGTVYGENIKIIGDSSQKPNMSNMRLLDSQEN